MKRCSNNKRCRSPSLSLSSGHSSEEPSGSVTSEEGISYMEPSMYDDLLMTLGFSSKSFAELYKRRQSEQKGQSDSEEEKDGDFESPSAFEEEEEGDEEGSDDDSKIHQMDNEPSEHNPGSLVEEDEMEEDYGASDDDQANGLENNGQADASESTRNHLGCTLSEAEVDDLTKRQCKFKWQEPAVNMSMSKWIGTGQCFLKVALSSILRSKEYSSQFVHFFEGRQKIMLYTERAHFFRRYKVQIRGIKNLIIYSLPERKEFYPEIVNLLEGSESMGCTILFSCFDHLRLERIVRPLAAKRMLSSKKDIFIFC